MSLKYTNHQTSSIDLRNKTTQSQLCLYHSLYSQVECISFCISITFSSKKYKIRPQEKSHLTTPPKINIPSYFSVCLYKLLSYSSLSPMDSPVHSAGYRDSSPWQGWPPTAGCHFPMCSILNRCGEQLHVSAHSSFSLKWIP